ncbi:MAG: prepilin-type N-terminal cleavage/methylation domain-containing protein [Patescibacteria group bacterium]
MSIKSANSKGFTLIELLVVIAIIGLLSSIVLASLKSARDKAHVSKLVQEVRQLKYAMEMYRSSTGSFYGPQVSNTFTYLTPPDANTRNALLPYIDLLKLDLLKTEAYMLSPIYAGYTCEGKLPNPGGYMFLFADAKITNEFNRWMTPAMLPYPGRFCFIND